MKTVLVSGGLGFLGIHVVKKLIESNYNVIVIDIKDFFERKKFIESTKKLSIIYRNLSENGAMDHLPDKVDYIIHLAALPHVDYSYYFEKETLNNNLYSLKNILDYAKNNGIKVLFASSVEVYGGNEDKTFYETDNLSPQSIYGYSKLICEKLIQYYIDKFQIECTILRLTNLYGPAQLPDRIIPRNICRLIDNMEFDLTSDFYRDFLYVEDAASAIVKMMEIGQNGEIYNLCSGISINMTNVANKILSILNFSNLLSFESDWINKGRGKYLKISSQKLSEFGCLSPISFDVGLQQTVLWYQQNYNWSQQFKTQYQKLRNSEQFIIDSHYIHSYINK